MLRVLFSAVWILLMGWAIVDTVPEVIGSPMALKLGFLAVGAQCAMMIGWVVHLIVGEKEAGIVLRVTVSLLSVIVGTLCYALLIPYDREFVAGSSSDAELLGAGIFFFGFALYHLTFGLFAMARKRSLEGQPA